MKRAFNNMKKYICDTFAKIRFAENRSLTADFNSRLYLQVITSFSFLILSIANIFSKSYVMLCLTVAGAIVNIVSAAIAKSCRNGKICSFSSIITCSLLFGCFVIYGGNDGFACLWVVLLPFLSMVVMDFVAGLCASIFFQIYLVVIFWTPVREMLFYQYNDQFCLRFPLFFFVTFILGLAFTVLLRKSQFNEFSHLSEIEKIAVAAKKSAGIDPLTQLANRRCAYEEFRVNYSDPLSPHCVILGDIDDFKHINDTYGHEFGDAVLVVLARYIKTLLPQDYLKVRWGGEEFLLAANEPVEEVYEKIETLRKTISEHKFECNNLPVYVTITFGISEYHGTDHIEKAISVADHRLYKGKKENKNCTVVK